MKDERRKKKNKPEGYIDLFAEDDEEEAPAVGSLFSDDDEDEKALAEADEAAEELEDEDEEPEDEAEDEPADEAALLGDRTAGEALRALRRGRYTLIRVVDGEGRMIGTLDEGALLQGLLRRGENITLWELVFSV